MMQGIGLEDLLKMLAGMSSREEREESEDQEENPEVLGSLPGIRQACLLCLNCKRNKIREKEQRLAALRVELDEEIKEHDSLVDEIRQLDAMFANADAATSAAGPVDAGSSEGPKPSDGNPASPKAPQEPVSPWLREKVDADETEPATNPQSGHKEKFPPEFKRLSKHRPTGNPRLDSLEMVLHDALERLNNTKMAFHFMAIKEVRLALTNLYQAWDKPEDERISELEAGLKDAVDKLSANPNAINSKVMPEIWGDIIVALQGYKDGNQ